MLQPTSARTLRSELFSADTAMREEEIQESKQIKEEKAMLEKYKNKVKRVGSAYAAFDKTVQEASQIRLVDNDNRHHARPGTPVIYLPCVMRLRS